MSDKENIKKEQKLQDIEELLKIYGDSIEIDRYVLKYLTIEELEKIEQKITAKQKSVIQDNSQWLQRFKKKL